MPIPSESTVLYMRGALLFNLCFGEFIIITGRDTTNTQTAWKTNLFRVLLSECSKLEQTY